MQSDEGSRPTFMSAILSPKRSLLPRGELFPAVNGNPTQPGVGALPGHAQPPPPRTRDRRHPAHEPAPSLHEVGSAARHGRANMGQTQRAGAETIARRMATQVAGAPGSAGQPYRGGATPAAGAPDKTDADAYPSRSKGMASIHHCERSRRTRHVSMNPLGFVTLSPTGRPSNRYEPTIFPFALRANSSRNKIAGLRGPPLRSGRRFASVQRRLSDGLFSVTEGNTLT